MTTPSLYLDFSPIFLKNPVCRGLFSNFLQSEFSNENFLFWHAVEDFKQLTDNSKLPSFAREIFNKVSAPKLLQIVSRLTRSKYIDDSSEYAVNLGFSVVQALNDKMCLLLSSLETTGGNEEKLELYTELSAMFDEAQDSILPCTIPSSHPSILSFPISSLLGD